MTLRAWRIVKTKYADTAFDGEGARLYGGRWSSPGKRVVYTAGTVALALLEMAVHAGRGLLPAYSVIPVALDEAQLIELRLRDLPEGWRSYPAPDALRRIGDEWLERGRSLALRVPSAVVPIESNYLLNPAHPEFATLRIGDPEPFELDLRLLG